MRIEGSCQCGKTGYSVESETPTPFMYCFCSICRKTAGCAFGCNVMGRRETLRVRGKRFLRRYHPRIRNRGERARISGAERWFCGDCGTHLYVLDDAWPDGVWPNAGAIDTELPPAPSRVFIMLRYKPRWIDIPGRGPRFPEYPKLSIAEWHRRNAKASPASGSSKGREPGKSQTGSAAKRP